MFRNFSYLASVSVLASTLLAPAGHAVFEEELQGEIKKFFNAQKNKREQSQEKNEPQGLNQMQLAIIEPEKKEGAATQSALSVLSSAIYTPIYCFGDFLSAVGDYCLSGETNTRSIIQKQALASMQEGMGLLDNKALQNIGNNILNDEESNSIIWNTFGNGSRALATFAQTGKIRRPYAESNLGSVLRDYFVHDIPNTKLYLDPSQAFPSVACALLLEDTTSKIAEHRLYYKNFVEKWNKGWWPAKSKDEGLNQQYYLQGIIRGYVKKEMPLNSEVLLTHIVNYDSLPIVKEITIENLVPDITMRKNLTVDEINTKLAEGRRKAFESFVTTTYKSEQKEYLIDKENISKRKNNLLLLGNNIDNIPQVLTIESAQSGSVDPTNQVLVQTYTKETITLTNSVMNKNNNTKEEKVVEIENPMDEKNL